MRRLTKEGGIAIAAKLGIRPIRRRNHDRVYVTVDNQLVGNFGLSRSSKSKPIAKAARQIGLDHKEALQLADCSLSKEAYEELIRQRRSSGILRTGP